MEHIVLALVGIIFAAIVVPISTLSMLKVIPRDGKST